LRTTLPLDLSVLPEMDSGRYHSLWLPDHMVSFWPDAIWTPEFTDLATTSPSPHRQLDSIPIAGVVAGLTKTIPIATSVVDTVRRHPTLLAQTALTLSHLSNGRFILGLGAGETENIVPYGFDFARPVGRFEEALRVIRLLWERTGPVEFEGQFYHLHHARLDTEPYEGRCPPIWVGGGGPRMLDITGRLADGWWPLAVYSPEEYAAKLATVRAAAERAGRDPAAITTALFWTCLMGEETALAEIFESKMIKAYFLLQTTGETMRRLGYAHPLGDGWRGFQDNDPSVLTREVILDMVEKIPAEACRKLTPNGTPAEIARGLKPYVEAGVEVYRIHDMSGLAGLKFAARTAGNIRAAEDELARLLEAA
jgi:phthiodiolone/phenolphthiodiolone dimycocerosates ketoreductase